MKDTVHVYADDYSRSRLVVHHPIAPNMRARFVLSMLERMGVIMGEPDGEDSAGRAKVRRSDVDEVVKYACDLSDATFNEFESRGWLVEVPAPLKKVGAA